MTQTTKQMIQKAGKRAVFFIAYACFFVFFWWVLASSIANEYVFPSFSDVWKDTGTLLLEREFYLSFASTLLRCVRVCAVSFLLACVVAVLAFLYPLFQKIVAPIVTIVRSLPTMAIMVMILIWSNPSDAPVVIGFLALFPMLYTGIYSALCTVNPKLIEMCKVYNVPLKKRIFSMFLPLSLPTILRTVGASCAFSVKLIVSAEVMARTYISIGGMVNYAQSYLMIPRMFSITILVVLVGVLTELLFIFLASLAERRMR